MTGSNEENRSAPAGDPVQQYRRSRRRRSLSRGLVYLSLAVVFYLLVPLSASPVVGALLVGVILFGVFWEFMFWRELLFGHPEKH